MHKNLIRSLALGGSLLLSLPALALSPASEGQLKSLQTRWAEINYKAPAAEREAAFEKLAAEADKAVQAEQAAELLTWRGIIYSTWAGAKGGLGALDLVKKAKADFEQSISLNPKALDGSAYTSLGSLYYQVPGWPIGFGDDEKAEQMLRQALQINPTGIDANYFYGDFLQREKRYSEAAAVLDKALKAPARPGRELADAGRRKEIEALQQQVRSKL